MLNCSNSLSGRASWRAGCRPPDILDARYISGPRLGGPTTKLVLLSVEIKLMSTRQQKFPWAPDEDIGLARDAAGGVCTMSLTASTHGVEERTRNENSL